MRDRLIELFTDTLSEWECEVQPETIAEIAEHLLENGVVIPPCKVGDTVYMPWKYKGIDGVALLTVTHIIIDNKDSYIKTDLDTDDECFYDEFNGGKFYFEELNKRFFLSIENARQALIEW